LNWTKDEDIRLVSNLSFSNLYGAASIVETIIAAWLITFHTHYDLTIQLNICILVLQVVIVFSGPWLCLDM
jgi:hypothetical protein